MTKKLKHHVMLGGLKKKMNQFIKKLKMTDLVEEVSQIKTYVYRPKTKHDKELVIAGMAPDSFMKFFEKLETNPPKGIKLIEGSLRWECNLVNPKIIWQQEEV